MSRLRILHLTDTHLFGDDSRHYGVVDTAEHLRLALAHVAEECVDLVVVSGDVSEDGSEESYRRVRDMIVPWAAERGARAVFAMGNHDVRTPFRAVLGGGQPGAEERMPAGDDPARPVVSATTADGWRVIVLDTSVPGRGYGSLDDGQLSFLRDELSQPAPHGTVLVLHHPPIPAHSDLLQALALGDADATALVDAVRGSDVRVVLAGHYHLPIVQTVAGIPVDVAPGVTNVARGFEDPAVESSADAFGGTIVEVDAGGVRVMPFIERPQPDAEVFRLDAAQVRRIIAEAGRG